MSNRRRDFLESPARSRSVSRYYEASPIIGSKFDTDGCRVCHKDDRHEEMLICDSCELEFHMDCLMPPLKRIPETDWYCSECAPRGDGLDELVAALPPEYTSRFGDIVWAYGGPSYGWWPSMIYNPRYTLAATRSEARKHLGKKHLCYFFQCNEVPFAVLPDNKIVEWYEGISMDLHLGKGSTSNDGSRRSDFEKALRIANLELNVPIYKRLELLMEPHADENLPSAQTNSMPSPVKAGSPVDLSKRSNKRKLPLRGSSKRSIARKRSLSTKLAATSSDAQLLQDSLSPYANLQRRRTPDPTFTTMGQSRTAGESIVAFKVPPSGWKPYHVNRLAQLLAQPIRKRISSTQAAPIGQNDDTKDDTEDDTNDDQDVEEKVVCRLNVVDKQWITGVRRGFLIVKHDITYAELRKAINETQEAELLPKDWRFSHIKFGSMRVEKEAELRVHQGQAMNPRLAGKIGIKEVDVSIIGYNDATGRPIVS